MTRKFIIVFIVLLLCFYSLISSILGERGFIANNQLKRQLKSNEYELDRKDVEIENLKIQETELSTEDGLRSAALNLGYQVDSDDVYIFQQEDVGRDRKTESVPVQDADNGKGQFEYWSSAFTLLISFCSSFIITFILWLFRKGKVEDHDSEQEESGDIRDNFNID